MEQFSELSSIITSGYQQAGWAGAIGAALMIALRVYRLESLQRWLPVNAQWVSWPIWAKFLTPFLLAFMGFIIPALVGKVALGTAIIGAISSGVAAIGLHHGTKLVGAAEFAMKQPTATPGALREKLSLVVPIPKEVQERAKKVND